MIKIVIDTVDGNTSTIENLSSDVKSDFLVAYYTGKVIKFTIDGKDVYFNPANIVKFEFVEVVG